MLDVIDMACHMIDIMRLITGEEPERVYATGNVFGKGKPRLLDIEDLAIDEANIEVSFTGDHQLQMYLNWGMPEGFPGTTGQFLIGPNGLVRESAGCVYCTSSKPRRAQIYTGRRIRGSWSKDMIVI